MIAAFLFASFAAIDNVQAEGEVNDVKLVERTYTLKYACLSVEEQVECGGEQAVMSVQKDGTRALRAYMDIKSIFTQNNSILRVGSDFRPIEGYSSVYVGETYWGSNLFVVDGSTLSVTVNRPNEKLSVEHAIPDEFSLLLLVYSGYGWLLADYDYDSGGVQTKKFCILVPDDRGTGCAIRDQPVEFVGKETISVPAGTFETEHFKIGRGDTWVTGTDRVVVRHEHPARNRRAQLVEYSVDP